jgi:uncharacterized membrane protein (UPF0127 family)
MAWLLRGGDVLCSLEIADGFFARQKGLLGRQRVDGAMLLPHTNGVHSVGMAFDLDVAWLDKEMRVLAVRTVPRFRLAPPRRHARSMLEAEAGAFERWNLRAGDVLEVRS